ncbi:MAG: hypothetical protein AVO34_13560 [Firmicutes bacterium ML8_F2]|nr:MAG: hypothetical protein AVO34_13560 [Firmicutes bacterium ML8_F2]
MSQIARTTKRAKDPSKFTDFDLWIRENENLDSYKAMLSIVDLDCLVYRIAPRSIHPEGVIYVLLLEEKTHYGTQARSQKIGHHLLDQCLKELDRKPVSFPKFLQRQIAPDVIIGPVVTLHYYGYHIITFSNTNPDNSDQIIWQDGPGGEERAIYTHQLEEILLFQKAAEDIKREARSVSRTRAIKKFYQELHRNKRLSSSR